MKALLRGPKEYLFSVVAGSIARSSGSTASQQGPTEIIGPQTSCAKGVAALDQLTSQSYGTEEPLRRVLCVAGMKTYSLGTQNIYCIDSSVVLNADPTWLTGLLAYSTSYCNIIRRSRLSWLWLGREDETFANVKSLEAQLAVLIGLGATTEQLSKVEQMLVRHRERA